MRLVFTGISLLNEHYHDLNLSKKLKSIAGAAYGAFLLLRYCILIKPPSDCQYIDVRTCNTCPNEKRVGIDLSTVAILSAVFLVHTINTPVTIIINKVIAYLVCRGFS